MGTQGAGRGRGSGHGGRDRGGSGNRRGRGREALQPHAGPRDRRSCSEEEEDEESEGNRDEGGASARRVIPGFYFDEVAQVVHAPDASSRVGALPAGGAAWCSLAARC